MINAEEAWQCILEHTRPTPQQQRPILAALHHYLASPVLADRDIPAFNRAAMDGYAVRAEDLATAPTVLRVVGEVPAGSSSAPPVSEGECVRIFTGANVPPDTDTVIMVEDTESDTATYTMNQVNFLRQPVRGQHIFRRGENARASDVLVAAGSRLDAVRLGICAMVGVATPTVHEKPRIAVLTTGTELKAASEATDIYEIRDSNGPMLAALLEAHGFSISTRQSVADDLAAIQQAIEELLTAHDVVLLTGGVSVGKYDFVPDAIEAAGGTTRYHGVRIKPGKPQLFATFPAGKHVFGLPGNPLSAITGMQEFVLPALRLRSGCPQERCRPVLHLPLGSDVQSKGKRQQYVLGTRVNRDGVTVVDPVPCAGSADLVAAGQADGAIMVPVGATRLAAGTTVAFRPWESVA